MFIGKFRIELAHVFDDVLLVLATDICVFMFDFPDLIFSLGFSRRLMLEHIFEASKADLYSFHCLETIAW